MSNPSLRIVSLNIHGDNHKPEQFAFLQKENPDVVCLQELYKMDIPVFEKVLGMKAQFAENVSITVKNEYNDAPRGPWGIALFSKYPCTNVRCQYYQMNGPQDSLFPDRGGPDEMARALLWAEVHVDGQKFTVATTHFTWAPNQYPTQVQLQAFSKLQTILDTIPEIILMGDFNAPRGYKIFDTLATRYTDNIPKTVTTTIDQQLHRKKGLQLVVDVLFTSAAYKATNVQVIDGVSDHCAISATIEKVG